MTSYGRRRGSVPRQAAEQARADAAIEDAERAASDEWSVLLRPRHSRRARQILIDVVVVVLALLVIALLS